MLVLKADPLIYNKSTRSVIFQREIDYKLYDFFCEITDIEQWWKYFISITIFYREIYRKIFHNY